MSGKIDNKVKILYIEDNQYNLLLVKKILLANGYEFYEAKTGFEGIDIAQKIFPDLILMDIKMPEMGVRGNVRYPSGKQSHTHNCCNGFCFWRRRTTYHEKWV